VSQIRDMVVNFNGNDWDFYSRDELNTQQVDFYSHKLSFSYASEYITSSLQNLLSHMHPYSFWVSRKKTFLDSCGMSYYISIWEGNSQPLFCLFKFCDIIRLAINRISFRVVHVLLPLQLRICRVIRQYFKGEPLSLWVNEAHAWESYHSKVKR
jgi:hypothetical protein